MGFLKRNWEKITADTISGVLIRVVATIVILGVGVGAYIAVPKFASQSEDKVVTEDKTATKDIIGLIRHVIFLVYFFCFLSCPIF